MRELNLAKEGRRPSGRKLKLLLLLFVILFSVVDIRLAGSHLARSFHIFRKAHQIIPVFVFGVSCWAFILALPLGLIPFRKLSYKNRYVCCALSLIILIDLLYLLSFVYMAICH